MNCFTDREWESEELNRNWYFLHCASTVLMAVPQCWLVMLWVWALFFLNIQLGSLHCPVGPISAKGFKAVKVTLIRLFTHPERILVMIAGDCSDAFLLAQTNVKLQKIIPESRGEQNSSWQCPAVLLPALGPLCPPWHLSFRRNPTGVENGHWGNTHDVLKSSQGQPLPLSHR